VAGPDHSFITVHFSLLSKQIYQFRQITDTEARVDLRHPAMGLHEAEQHCHNTAIPKQSTQ
jgi:hypothetical protein